MSSGQGGPHPLAFRVMRLCKPSFQVDPIPLLLDPADLVVGEDVFDDPMAAAQLPRLLDVHDSLNPSSSASSDSSDLTYRTRFLLHHPSSSTTPPPPLASLASSSSPKPSEQCT
ncbi:hypothetical protein ACFX1T_036805 [Malus domestica]